MSQWTNDITFLTHVEPLPIYRRLDEQSNLVCNGTLPFTNDQALHILDIMIRVVGEVREVVLVVVLTIIMDIILD